MVWYQKERQVNTILKAKCTSQNFMFIDNENIELSDVSEQDRVHLYESGSIKLANNILNALNSQD